MIKKHKRREVYYHQPDFCRVDYENGLYEYLANDERIVAYNSVDETDTITTYYDYRSALLLHDRWQYVRIKRLTTLPKGKTINTLYHRNETEEK